MASAGRLSGGATGPTVGGDVSDMRGIPNLWWLRLVVGIGWCVAALVILQFDRASVTTVGVIVGIMFLAAGCQALLLAAIGARTAWVGYLFGVLFVIAGLLSLFNPEDTFAGVADILGFLFLVVSVSWTVEAFLMRSENPLWWVGLIGGLFMLVIAFWTSGQFFIEKAYVLLVFAGIWALMHGITDIFRAFTVRSIRDAI
jgi:uncharacterized membrane protein HdeD (DUF308 family)